MKYKFFLCYLGALILSSFCFAYLVFGDVNFIVANRNDFTRHQNTVLDFIFVYLVITFVPSIFSGKIIWYVNFEKKLPNIFYSLEYFLFIVSWVVLIYIFCLLGLDLDVNTVTNVLFHNYLKLLFFLFIGCSSYYFLQSFFLKREAKGGSK